MQTMIGTEKHLIVCMQDKFPSKSLQADAEEFTADTECGSLQAETHGTESNIKCIT